MVVIDPAPAIKGKAIGKIDPDPCDSVLKSSMPSTISIAIRNMIKDPAMANEDTSIPKTPSNGLPMNRKEIKIRNETSVTFADLTSPDLALMPMIIGIEPGISIMAKRTMKAAKISIKSKCMILNLRQR
jgi:hypothetical protein